MSNNFFNCLGGAPNVIAAKFGNWKNRTVIVHLYKVHALDVNKLIRAGHSIYLAPGNLVRIVLKSYKEWNQIKNDARKWFGG